MKKFLRIMSIILVCVLLVGCGNNNNAQIKLAGQKLTNELDKIVAQVKKMETVDTNQMDISSSLGDYYYDYDYDYSDDYDYMYAQEGNKVSAGEMDNYGYARPRTAMDLEVPTNNHLIKQTSASLDVRKEASLSLGSESVGRRQSKRFNFVSKDTEDSYSSLYMLCNDCCNLNEELNYTKKDLIGNCENAKSLLNKLKDSGINVSESDLKTLNSYYEVLSRCVSNLGTCSDCSSCVKNVNNKKANLASNCGSMNADYIQIYNTLDSNCCSCNNCNMSVEDLISFVTKLLDSSNQGVTRDNVSNSPRIARNSSYVRNSRNISRGDAPTSSQLYRSNRRKNSRQNRRYFFNNNAEQQQDDLSTRENNQDMPSNESFKSQARKIEEVAPSINTGIDNIYKVNQVESNKNINQNVPTQNLTNVSNNSQINKDSNTSNRQNNPSIEDKNANSQNNNVARNVNVPKVDNNNLSTDRTIGNNLPNNQNRTPVNNSSNNSSNNNNFSHNHYVNNNYTNNNSVASNNNFANEQKGANAKDQIANSGTKNSNQTLQNPVSVNNANNHTTNSSSNNSNNNHIHNLYNRNTNNENITSTNRGLSSSNTNYNKINQNNLNQNNTNQNYLNSNKNYNYSNGQNGASHNNSSTQNGMRQYSTVQNNQNSTIQNTAPQTPIKSVKKNPIKTSPTVISSSSQQNYNSANKSGSQINTNFHSGITKGGVSCIGPKNVRASIA